MQYFLLRLAVITLIIQKADTYIVGRNVYIYNLINNY